MTNEDTLLSAVFDIKADVGFIKGETTATREELAEAFGRLNSLESEGCAPGKTMHKQVGKIDTKVNRIILVLVALAASAGGLGGVVKLLGLL